jgi:hypothetical protein
LLSRTTRRKANRSKTKNTQQSKVNNNGRVNVAVYDKGVFAMKRSEVNAVIKQFEALLDQYKFRIPPRT